MKDNKDVKKDDNLLKFLISLGSDPQKLSQFFRDPTTIMVRDNLSKAEQAILLTGDPELINQAVFGILPFIKTKTRTIPVSADRIHSAVVADVYSNVARGLLFICSARTSIRLLCADWYFSTAPTVSKVEDKPGMKSDEPPEG